MGSIKFSMFVLCIVGISLRSQCQLEPRKNSIEFKKPLHEVADSIYRMEILLQKFPQTYSVNYFVDIEGQLYLNNQKIAPLKNAVNNPKVRKDMVFQDFNNDEINEFFYLMAYLWRNEISSASRDEFLGKMTFSYGAADVKSRKDERFLMVVSQPSDTLDTVWKKWFKVLDKKEKLVLFGIK